MLVDLQKAHPGMIIAEDVTHPRAGLLIRKQQLLTAELIPVLLKFGIKQINIQDSDSISKNPTVIKTDTVAPTLQLIIEENLLSATLILEPNGENTADISTEFIINALSQKKIKHGIDIEIIDSIVDKWNQEKSRIEIKDIAKGAPALPAIEGNYQFAVPYLSTHTLVDMLRNASYFWEVAKFVPQTIKKINSGAIIAKKSEDIPSIPGTDILGASIYTDTIINQNLNLAENVQFSEDGKYLIAKTQGIPYLVDDTVGVLSIKFDGKVDVQIQTDYMAASLVIHPPFDGGLMPSEHEIFQSIYKKNINYGILQDRISELITNFSHNQYPEEPVVIAEGIPSRNGENGYVKLLFNAETTLKPQQNPDGSVDYKNITIINTVKKGQKLAELIAPTSGVPGKNILGQPLRCIDGTPVKLTVGLNTEIDPQNKNILLSTTDGFVRLTNSLIEVSEGLVINGNVDFSTGNVKYDKNVVISGDIKSGFDVDCGGDLQVNGTIEDCKITSAGNILCRMGFIGQGKGLIDAKGDVNLNFTKNQLIKSRQNVNIAKEAIHSNIFARGSITIHGKPLSAAGGLLTAGDSISFFTVGNNSGIKTILEVGIDFTLVEELRHKESLLLELSNNFTKLQETQKKFDKILCLRKQLPPKEKALLEKVRDTITKYKQQIDNIEQQKTQISSKMYKTSNAFIRIEHSAMPGTIFKFGERHFLVKEEILGPKTVRLIDHEIKVI